MITLTFLDLDHVLWVFSTYHNYLLCSLDIHKCIGNNKSIIWLTHEILSQQKDIFVDILKVILR